jgi:N-acyl-D-amino-acid deacylase
LPLDLVIEGATLHDGAGGPPRVGDLGIVGDRIAEVGDLSSLPADRRIPARGLVLCPGFVDIHSHADFTIARLDHPRLLAPLLLQGITTFIGGNCGAGPAPAGTPDNEAWTGFLDFFLGENPLDAIRWRSMGEFLALVESQGALLNMGVLAPHGVLRMLAMETRKGAPRAADLASMTRALEQCLEEGALGLSAGLQYFPGLDADTAELTALGRVLHDHGGFLSAHLRSYNSDTLPLAVDEILQVGRDAEIPVQISHLFWCPNPPRPLRRPFLHLQRLLSRAYGPWMEALPVDAGPRAVLRQIARAVATGQPVGVDAMPTAAAFTHLIAFFPPWVVEGSRTRILERLSDPAFRKRIRHAIERGRARWPHREGDTWSLNHFQLFGWEMATIMSLRSERNQRLVGRTFVEIARERRQHPLDAVCDVFLEEEGRILVFETTTHPGDPFVELAQRSTLATPFVSVGTDAILMGFGRPSHLFHDAFPRFLRYYCLDRDILPLAEGIRKCTSLPARQAGIRERGLLREGYKADLVLFDPRRLGSTSTLDDPARRPEGILHVLVNGVIVVDPVGRVEGPLRGEVIRA